jgi:hypothetical protein
MSTDYIYIATLSYDNYYANLWDYSNVLLCDLGPVWLDVLKFNKYCSTFVLFDKKISILD